MNCYDNKKATKQGWNIKLLLKNPLLTGKKIYLVHCIGYLLFLNATALLRCIRFIQSTPFLHHKIENKYKKPSVVVYIEFDWTKKWHTLF